MNEKKFVWKQTNDGTFHLFLDDPAKSDFEKLASGTELKVIKDGSHIVMPFASPYGKKLITLWCIIENRVFEETLSANTEIIVLEGHPLYKCDGQWYAMVPQHDGGWKEQLLGEKFENFLSCPDNITYKRLYYNYFLRGKNGESVKLNRFIDGKLEVSDEYCEFVECGAKLIALRKDDVSDVFVPNQIEPVKGSEDEAFEAFGGVYAWSEQDNGWLFYPNFSIYAKNAVYRIWGEYREKIELCRLEKGQLYAEAEGPWYWKAKALCLCIKDVCYIKDDETGLVDFDNPKPTFKKRIKDFFKRN